jgi:hypothetical protein
MVDKLFMENFSQADNRIMDIAKKLLKRGVDKNIIKESTGLPIEKIDKLVVE